MSVSCENITATPYMYTFSIDVHGYVLHQTSFKGANNQIDAPNRLYKNHKGYAWNLVFYGTAMAWW